MATECAPEADGTGGGPGSGPNLPLAGLRVLDVTQILSGPFATQILADLGAEVLKVEGPDGDKARRNGPIREGKSSYFASLNRGKKSVVLNLREQDDRTRFCALATDADVLVENFRPGVMERLGISYAQLRSANPRLIYASCSGFGQNSARKGAPALDMVIQALAGTLAITGGEAPARAGFSAGDIGAGLYLAIGVLALLARRARTGGGGYLDLSMLDCQVALLENAFARYFATGQEPHREGTRHPVMAPFAAYDTADRAIVIAVSSTAHWSSLCRCLGHPEWAEDARFHDGNSRRENLASLDALLLPVLRARNAATWLDRLQKLGVPCGLVRSVSETAADPDLEARGMFTTVDYAGSPFRVVASPLVIDGVRHTASSVPSVGDAQEWRARSWTLGYGP